MEDAQVRILKHIVAPIVYSVLGALVLGLVFYLHLLEGRPSLEPWHTAKLDEEFRASRANKVKDLAGYMQLEERLFDQLQREAYEKTQELHRNELLRYDSASMADPNRYGRNWNRSFEHPVDKPRAGVLLLHGLTDSPYSVQTLAEILHRHGAKGFPPALVFQSLVDATVIPAALVDRLMRRLAPGHHELVIFDVNRLSEAAPFLRADKESLRDVLVADDTLPFTFTLITNTSEHSADVKAHRKLPRSKAAVDEPLGLAWPRGIYSLAHIALPFPPDDPVYGYAASPGKGEVHLGRLELRGERGLLLVSSATLTRLHANPFFPYVVERILAFLQLSGDSD